MQLSLFTRRHVSVGLFALLTLAVTSASATYGSYGSSGPSRDNLTLLIPDNAAVNSWQVQVWTDAAAENGIQIKTITNSAFLALGSTAASKIAGLVMPDSAHIQASNTLVNAVKQYVSGGGKLMLTTRPASPASLTWWAWTTCSTKPCATAWWALARWSAAKPG